MQLSGIFLDFDGVISQNSPQLMIQWLHDYARRVSGLPIGEEIMRGLGTWGTAFPPRDLLNLFFRSFGILVEVGEVQQLMHREISPAIQIDPAFTRLIESCNQQGIQLKVLSQRSATTGTFNQLHHVPGLELHMICSTQGLSKANPECYRQVGQSLGLDLSSWLMVDDSPYALRGAKLAGLKTALMVTSNFNVEDYLHYQDLIDLRLSSLADLLPVIKSPVTLAS